MFKFLFVGCLTAALATLSSLSSAALIGVNFVGGNESGGNQTLTASQTAGIVNQANWNNRLTDAVFANLALNDSTGTASPITLTFARSGSGSANSWQTAAIVSGATHDGVLMRGILKTRNITNNQTGTMTFTFNNVPTLGMGQSYELFAYVANDVASRSNNVNVAVNGGAPVIVDEATITGGFTPANFVEVSGEVGNYIHFENLTPNGSSQIVLTLSNTYVNIGGGDNAGQIGILGIQLNTVPEPSGLVLAAVCSLGLVPLLRRRRLALYCSTTNLSPHSARKWSCKRPLASRYSFRHRQFARKLPQDERQFWEGSP